MLVRLIQRAFYFIGLPTEAGSPEIAQAAELVERALAIATGETERDLRQAYEAFDARAHETSCEAAMFEAERKTGDVAVDEEDLGEVLDLIELAAEVLGSSEDCPEAVLDGVIAIEEALS